MILCNICFFYLSIFTEKSTDPSCKYISYIYMLVLALLPIAHRVCVGCQLYGGSEWGCMMAIHGPMPLTYIFDLFNIVVTSKMYRIESTCILFP